jgi:hypothetical protein
MSDGVTLALIVILALIYGRLCGIREEIKRVADFCDRSEKRMTGSNQ